MTSADSAPASALVPGEVPGKVFRSELNPVDFLRRAAYLYPDKTAVIDGGRRYSYRQLAERSWRLANALRSSGLGKGDRVATLLFNSSAMLEAHFGVPAAGGILVAVNHRLASAEIGYILEHSGARYLLLDAGFEALARPLELADVTVIRCAGSSDPGDPYGQFLAGASPERPASWLEHEEETISVNYTSGTTGLPKGVQYTYRGAYLNALSEVIHAKTWKTSRPPGVVVHLMQGPEPGAAAAQLGHDGPSPTTGSPRSARPPQTAAMTRSWTRCCCGCTPRGPASPGTIRTYRAVSRFRQVSGRSSAGCATRVVHDVSRAVGAVRGSPGFRRGCALRRRTRLACQRNRVRGEMIRRSWRT